MYTNEVLIIPRSAGTGSGTDWWFRKDTGIGAIGLFFVIFGKYENFQKNMKISKYDFF